MEMMAAVRLLRREWFESDASLTGSEKEVQLNGCPPREFHAQVSCDHELQEYSRTRHTAWATESRYGSKWQRKIKPISRAAAPGRSGRGRNRGLPGTGRRLVFDTMGWPGIHLPPHAQPRSANRRHPTQGSCQSVPGFRIR